MRRYQGHKQAKDAKVDVESIEEGGQHEPSSCNNSIVHNLVSKAFHKTLQLEGIKMFKYL